MTLLFTDGAEADDFALEYNVISGVAAGLTDTAFGVGRSFGLTSNIGNGQIVARKDFPPMAKMILGFRTKTQGLSDTVNYLNLCGDLGTTAHVSLRFMLNGAVALYRGATQIALSTPGLIPINAWFHVEISATVHDTAGRVIVRINGGTTPVIDFTGDTKNAGTASTLDSFQFLHPVGLSLVRYDDIYVCDGLGASHNDFLGDVRVIPLVATAAGTNTALTSSGGANHTAVDELPYSAADYVSGTAGKDTYVMADLPSGVAAIHGVKVKAIAKKTDAGARSLKTIVRSAGTDYASSAVALGTSDSVISAIHQVNPATGAAWTVPNVNAMEIGAEVV